MKGALDCPGTIPIIGTFAYPEFGTVEHVPAETAHDPASLRTLLGIPLTIDHPSGMVDADNARDLTHGWVLDYAPTPEGVEVTVRVVSREAIDVARRDGVVQLSLGYDCDVDDEAGVDGAGKPYTGVQRGRVYNHLAQVGLARVGGRATLRFDAMKHAKLVHSGKTYLLAAALVPGLSAQVVDAATARKDAIEVAEVVIDGVAMVLPRAVVDAIIAMLSGGAAGAEPPVVDEAPVPPVDPNAPPRLDSLPPALAAQVRKLVEDTVASSVRRADGETRQRLEVERLAGEILGPTFDYATSDTWEIAATAVTHVDSGAKASVEALALKARKGDPMAQGRLLGRFDAAVAEWQEAYDNGGSLAIAIDEGRRKDAATGGNGDDDKDDEGPEAARQRMIARQTADRSPKAAAKAG